MSQKDRERRRKLLDDAKEMAAATKAQIESAPVKGGKESYLKLPNGVSSFAPVKDQEYKLIFLPWEAGPGSHRPEGKAVTVRNLRVHRQIGPNGESYNCPESMPGKKRCAICAEFRRLQPLGRGKDYWSKHLKHLVPQNRQFFLVHDTEGAKNNIQCWEEAEFNFGKHLTVKLNPKDEKRRERFQKWANLSNGFLVIVTGREESMGEGKYTKFSSIEFEDRTDRLSKELIDKLLDLSPDEWAIPVSGDKLSKFVTAPAEEQDEEPTDEDEEEPEDPSDLEDEEPEEKPKTKPANKSKEPEPEDDEEETEEDEEESDDDEETEEDEEESDDDEDDEEPEPPKKPVKKK